MQNITPCLWFNTEAEEAVNFYLSVFSDSKIKKMSLYTGEAAKAAGVPDGHALTIDFVLNGQPFTALNGGPAFTFNEAVSFVVTTSNQDETDYYWEKLTEGGIEQPCAWLKDKYGVSWQIVPQALITMLGDADRARASRVMQAMLQMKKINIDALERAYHGA